MNTRADKQNATATAKANTESCRILDEKTLDNLSNAMHGDGIWLLREFDLHHGCRGGICRDPV